MYHAVHANYAVQAGESDLKSCIHKYGLKSIKYDLFLKKEKRKMHDFELFDDFSTDRYACHFIKRHVPYT